MPLYRKSLRLSSIHRKALAYSQSWRKRVLRKRFEIPGFQVVFVARSEKRSGRIEETCNGVVGIERSTLFLHITLAKINEGHLPWENTIKRHRMAPWA